MKEPNIAATIVRKLYDLHGKEKTIEILENAFVKCKNRKLRVEYTKYIVELHNHKEEEKK